MLYCKQSVAQPIASLNFSWRNKKMKNQFSAPLSRRQFLQVAGMSAASVALAACVTPGAAPQAGAGAAEGAAAGAAEIQFWDMVWGPPEYIEAAKKLVEQFNSETPAIKVTYTSNQWSSWPQVFTTAIGSGTAPDVSTGGGFQPVQFYADGAILPVDDLLAEVGSDDFPGAVLAANEYDGHNLAIPWNLDIRGIFYRTDLFEAAGAAAPTTWDELRTALKAVTKDNTYGLGFAGNSPLGWQQMWGFLHNNGGGLFTTDGKLDVMNERNVEAVEFIASLVADGVVHPGSAGFSDTDLAKAWAESTVSMLTWGFNFEKRAPDLVPKTAVLSPLAGPHGDKGALVWINGLMMYNQTKNADATKTFLKWYSKNAKPLWTEGNCGVLPARISIASDPFFQDNPPTKALLNEWVPIATGLGNKQAGTSPLLGKIDGSGIPNTLCTDILQGMNATEALQKAADALAEIK